MPRLAILTDFPDEGWPSMDLCGDMLLAHLPRDGPFAVEAARLCPPFRRLATRLPAIGRRHAALNADRLLNRFVHFPSHARRLAGRFVLFHIADHTYAQLAHALPAGRAGVYCHDLDAFRCLLDPARDPRPRWFRALARRILTGLEKAAVVFHGTAAVGEQLNRAGLLSPDRLVLAPYGVAPEFAPGPARPPVEPRWLAELGGRPWVLHVGSCIPRKRIDVLLDVVAAVRAKVPDLRLVKVGGEWLGDHPERIARLGLAGAIAHVGGLARAELAEVYRRAAVVLVPSEAEGFGLPVIEALACGASVVASDIPALREAGGPAAAYVPVGDVGAWAGAVAKVLTDPDAAPPRAGRLEWASRFSWAAHAETIARAYLRLLQDSPPTQPAPCRSPS
jgi:glycosyltransferase involved in cell wall biosynthesis